MFSGVRIHGRTAIAQQILSGITSSTGIHASVIAPRPFMGTAAAGGAATITLVANAGFGTALEGMYDGWTVHIHSGTGAGQERIIVGYVGSTRVATVAAWVTQPSTDSVYHLRPPYGDDFDAQGALIKVESAAILFTLNGSVPTVSTGTNIGMKMDPGESIYLDDIQNIKNFKCINSANANGAIVKIITFA
jgi:hypothetical protein